MQLMNMLAELTNTNLGKPVGKAMSATSFVLLSSDGQDTNLRPFYWDACDGMYLVYKSNWLNE